MANKCPENNTVATAHQKPEHVLQSQVATVGDLNGRDSYVGGAPVLYLDPCRTPGGAATFVHRNDVCLHEGVRFDRVTDEIVDVTCKNPDCRHVWKSVRVWP